MITHAEYEAISAARIDAIGQDDKFQSGWLAGVEYERQRPAAAMKVANLLIADLQATLDRERAERLAYQEMIAGRLQRLVEGL